MAIKEKILKELLKDYCESAFNNDPLLDEIGI